MIASSDPVSSPVPVAVPHGRTRGRNPESKRKLNAEVKAKIAASQKARWAAQKLRASQQTAQAA